MRIQTDSFPDHCYNSATLPQANDIDFITPFNPSPPGFVNVSITTQAVLDAQICSDIWPTKFTNPAGFSQYLGNINGMVGIAFTGVPIFDGSSEANVDALFPNPNIPANNYLKTMDACLGNVDH